MKIRKLSSAEEEFVEAAEFYLSESPRAAERFAVEVEEAVLDIARDPLRDRIFEGRARRRLLKNFPYSIIYLVYETEILIIAIMHHARKPGYWKNRMR